MPSQFGFCGLEAPGSSWDRVEKIKIYILKIKPSAFEKQRLSWYLSCLRSVVTCPSLVSLSRAPHGRPASPLRCCCSRCARGGSGRDGPSGKHKPSQLLGGKGNEGEDLLGIKSRKNGFWEGQKGREPADGRGKVAGRKAW